MWQFEHHVMTQAPHSRIWELWTNVADWPEWDHSLAEAKLENTFDNGGVIHLQPMEGHALKANIVHAETYKGFTLEIPLALASMICTYEIKEIGDENRITHRVEIKGPLAFMWTRILSRKIEQSLPLAMGELIQHASALATSPF
jgi:hypothetical protein